MGNNVSVDGIMMKWLFPLLLPAVTAIVQRRASHFVAFMQISSNKVENYNKCFVQFTQKEEEEAEKRNNNKNYNKFLLHFKWYTKKIWITEKTQTFGNVVKEQS